MLNACPKCQRTFPADEAAFCPEDATKLQPIDAVAVPADPNDPLVGQTIAGRYEIRRVIADGGMGRVYEGRQREVERRVALKILHTEVAEDPVNIERFRREAETSRTLEHDHIVEVFDFNEVPSAPGRQGSVWFLVMEYLDGEELRSLLNRAKVLPLARTIRIISQTAIALDGAHQRGLVHRDLKPDNIFLVRTPEGDRVKLLDFGSVKFTKGQDKGHKLTVMGTTIGSPYYMSPEQAQGRPDLDHRADVWAIGAILYEMQVGQVPFNAPNGPQILFKILGEEPMPPSFAKDDAPPQLDDVVTKALSKKRESRYQSCGELADALGHAFGLTGSHTQWAYLSESDLGARLAAGGGAQPQVAAGGGGAMPFPAAPQPGGGAMPFPVAQQGGGFPASGGGFPVSGGGDVPPDYTPVKPAPKAIYAAIGAAVLLGTVLLYLALK